MNSVSKSELMRKRIVLSIILIAFYYVSFRYPFQIGDASSPTYTPTPLWLQILKFALLSVIFPFSWLLLRKDKRFTVLEQMITVFAILATMYCGVIGLLNIAMATRLLEIGFTMLFAIPFASAKNFVMQTTTFVKALSVFFWINILSYALQISLFFFYGRLPGLAYGGSTTRFGGIWDDPNSALAPFALFVPYWLIRHGLGKTGIILIGLTLISIIIAQSVTSLVSIVVGIPILFLIFRKGQWSPQTKTRVFLTVGVGGVAIVLAAIILYNVIDFAALMRNLSATLDMKQSSAAMRSQSYSMLGDASLLSLFGLDPLLAAGENEFVNVFANFGLPMLVLFVAIHIMVLNCLYIWAKRAPTRQSYALAVGCVCYFLWYFISMVNIPKAEVFPVNLLAAVVAGMAIAAKKSLARDVNIRREQQAPFSAGRRPNSPSDRFGLWYSGGSS